MSFDLSSLLVFATAAVLYAGLLSGRWRGWALLIGSALGVYWLQPNLTPRFASYALQTAVLLLTVFMWQLSRQRDDESQQATRSEDRRTLLVLLVLILGVALLRFLPADYRPIAYRPPSPLTAGLAVGLVSLIFLGIAKLAAKAEQRKVLTGGILFIVALFVVLKTPALVTAVSHLWRSFTAQDTSLAAPSDLAWLGFSYVAFRLIHTLRDRQTGILPVLSLREYVTYVIFAPAYIAGPIDRAERFVQDLRALPQMRGLDAARFGEGGYRIAIGLFKKFVIADTLAQGMSLTAVNAGQATSTLALWVLLYGYALRLYFDFAGYTDIAIGLGLLFGIRLPENFNRPYLRSNITAFWQNWHATLSSWARFYVFTPLSRTLLRRKPRPSTTLIVFVAQTATMLTIGLWHGVSWNYFVWGLWHGAALFAHKQWSDRTRPWYRSLEEKPGQKRAWSLAGWWLTFNFVCLGWVWFLLPLETAVTVFGRLFGFGW
ncbi:MAG: MBOAT family O-acyltransferase [Chloroflexota bacterium]